MTRVDVRPNPRSANEPPTERQKRKSVLFCPVCGHESPVDGNWIVGSHESQHQFRCPECEQVVAVR